MQTIDEIISELEKLRDEFGGDYVPNICLRKEKLNPENNIDVDYYICDDISVICGEIEVGCPINMNMNY